MKYVKKLLKFLSYTFIIAFVSIGLGINGVIFPVFRKEEKESDQIEMVESKDDDKSG